MLLSFRSYESWRKANSSETTTTRPVASAAATLNLINPWGLNLTASATQPCVQAGDVVTYIYTIDNIGDFSISELNLTDSISGVPIPINVTLSPKESIALTANWTVTTDLPGPLTNSVAVLGFNSKGEMVGSSTEVVLPQC